MASAGTHESGEQARRARALPPRPPELAATRRRAERPRAPRARGQPGQPWEGVGLRPRTCRGSLAASGLFLFLLASYVLTNAGRIDIIDGQVRYDVAKNWIEVSDPIVRDPALFVSPYLVKKGQPSYSTYNGAASVTPMPLMALSRLLPGHTEERDRFAFSMAGPFFGAAVGTLLMVAYAMVGFDLRTSMLWALVFSFGTLWWPGSLTVFDQNQHAFFLLASMLLAWQSGRRQRVGLAALGGLAGGLLIAYQESYALLLPLVGLAVFASPQEGVAGVSAGLRRSPDRAALRRYVAFGVCGGGGLVLFLAFNYFRFHSLVPEARYDNAEAILFSGNPVAAFLSLAISPGKSAFLFSPPLFLVLGGARRLFARAPILLLAIAGASIVHILVVIQLSFFGGDWCWGPRYLLPLIPLWALALPFRAAHVRRGLVIVLVGLGVTVQLMAISLDYQRFFFEHNLAPYFWLDQWAYFKRSQLFSRPGELISLALEGVPPEAKQFSPTPGGQVTYTPAGPSDSRTQGATWVRRFRVFHTLRPWPFWIRTLEPARRPLDPGPLELFCGVLLVGGTALGAVGLRRGRAA